MYTWTVKIKSTFALISSSGWNYVRRFLNFWFGCSEERSLLTVRPCQVAAVAVVVADVDVVDIVVDTATVSENTFCCCEPFPSFLILSQVFCPCCPNQVTLDWIKSFLLLLQLNLFLTKSGKPLKKCSLHILDYFEEIFNILHFAKIVWIFRTHQTIQ